MRHYQKLDSVTYDEDSDTLSIGCSDPEACDVNLWFGREGMYLSVSANVGPLEVALRPRLRDLKSSLGQLKPTERLAVMRMVGTGQAHLELGLNTAGELLIRTTIVADATGHFAVNMLLASEVRQRLFEWLDVENAAIT
jgi:hypothetical protein